MTIKAALLDERGIYLRMDELEDDSELTALHLTRITVCDLPPARYVWIPDERLKPDRSPINPYGGAFWEIEWLKRVTATHDKAIEDARRFNTRIDNPPSEVALLMTFMKSKGL